MPADDALKKRPPGRGRALAIDCYIGAKVRELRVMLGISQQQLGELIGVTAQQMTRYEAGTTRLNPGGLFAIAAALGVKPSAFFPQPDQDPSLPPATGRFLLEIARNFAALSDEQRRTLHELARLMMPP